VEERGGDQRERNLEVGTSWFQRQEDWAAVPADDGPDEWQRVPVEIDFDARIGEPDERSRNVDYVVPTEAIDVVELDPVEVGNVEVAQQSISFDVDQVGVPVLVRVSYFPTWKVDGAEGPYRVAPNFMVVIPTENQVTLSYSKTPLDWFFYSLTALGIALCVYWRRKGDMVFPSDRPGRRLAPQRSNDGAAWSSDAVTSGGETAAVVASSGDLLLDEMSPGDDVSMDEVSPSTPAPPTDDR
jgi:hypothetical protein